MTKTAAYAGKFMRPRLDVPDLPLADIAYAFHFDASLYARFLRRYAEARGTRRIEGKVTHVSRDGATGDLTGLTLANGKQVDGEFFVDCSGFRGRLIEEEFKSGYDDWTHWLPCDRAVTTHCASPRPIVPFSARPRTAWAGNGVSHCSTAPGTATRSAANISARTRRLRSCWPTSTERP